MFAEKEIHVWVKKVNLFIFAHAPKQNAPRDRRKLRISAEPENLFFLQEKERRIKLKKITKIKLAMALVTSFEKLHHFCSL